MTDRYDGHAMLLQGGRRFPILCSVTADGRGSFNPADGSDAPAVGSAMLEATGRRPCAVEIVAVERVEPRFGDFRIVADR